MYLYGTSSGWAGPGMVTGRLRGGGCNTVVPKKTGFSVWRGSAESLDCIGLKGTHWSKETEPCSAFLSASESIDGKTGDEGGVGVILMPSGDMGRSLKDWFVRNIVRRLFPSMPNDSSAFSVSSEVEEAPSEEAANDGDRGRLDPVNNPFRADTVDLVGLTFAWDRVDWDELQISCSCPTERAEVSEAPRERFVS